MKLENEELELLLGPDDSEVNLRYATRRDDRKIKNLQYEGKREHSVASNVRWDER